MSIGRVCIWLGGIVALAGCQGPGGPCAPDACSGRGSCVDVNGAAVCTCEPAYTGERCEGCAVGYQDRDGDSTCRPACGHAGLDCGRHGRCDDSRGEAACACDDGYAGAACESCAEGWQDGDADGFCRPTCAAAGLACRHGQCDESHGAPRCACEVGYVGRECDECAADYQDNDQDGTCFLTCARAALGCAHGTCSDLAGPATCVCTPGYDGTRCEACAPGYQDRDEDGTCAPDCTTAGLLCGAHGACDDGGGEAACACEPGYAGGACETCAAGYQDHDLDGSCAPDCATAGPGCGAHGACHDSSGTAACVCHAGYAGGSCETCAAGSQDRDANGTCAPDCATAGVACGAHGVCDDASGTAGCVCEAEYAGARCETCAGGYQDVDGDGTCQPGCALAALTCPGHGRCSEASGTAACVCDTGYTPPECTACATGYQDHDGDGSCLPTCAQAGYTCSGHGSCDDANGTAQCDCDAATYDDGYGHCLVRDGHDCGAAIPVVAADVTLAGTTAGAGNEYSGSCYSPTGAEVVYALEVPVTLHLQITMTGTDPVVYLRSTCGTAGSQIACHVASAGTATLDVTVAAGTYALFADGKGAAGAFTLTIGVVCPAGEIYDPGSTSCVDDPCDPNLCADPHQHQCVPVLPAGYECHCDPGYIPDGAACVVDPSTLGESCATPIVLAVGEGQVGNTTATTSSHGVGTCGGNGPDRIYSFTLTERMRFEVLMQGYDTVLHLRRDCADPGSQLGCNDDGVGQAARLIVFLDPGVYFLFADSFSSGGGTYTLTYSFRADPCDPNPCAPTFACTPDADWSGRTCACAAGTLLYNGACVDDPCDPSPCLVPNKNRCAPNLPASYTCTCNIGYRDDGGGGCEPDPNAKDWAFIVFMNADNNLESFGYLDLAEMEAVGSNAGLDIVVLMDTATGDGGDARKLHVNQGSSTVVENLGEVDMSDWHTLADFGVWAVQTYPARHHMLVLWDHGSGWRGPEVARPYKGFSNDDHPPGNEMSIANGDFARALAAITAARGGKLDLVGFDACLMGMWEVAEATGPYARYLIGSEELEPGEGWPYDDLLGPLAANTTMGARDLGTNIVDAYYAASTSDTTLAEADLDTLPDLATTLSAFADALGGHPALFTQFETARTATQMFTYGDDRDLWDFAIRAKAIAGVPADVTTAANALITQLGITIVHNHAQAGYSGAHGLSIYFPAKGSGVDPAYTDVGAIWNSHATWGQFLAAFAP
jgi:hypothetical protein